MPTSETSARRVYAALMVEEAIDDVTWSEAIRRWSRADDGRSPVGDGEPPEWFVENADGRQVALGD